MARQFHRLRARLVKKLQKRSGKTWEEVAEFCHVHRGTVMRWLSGVHRLGDGNISLLARAIGTTSQEIILPDGEEDSIEEIEQVEVTIHTDVSPQDLIASIKQQKILYDDIEFAPELSSHGCVTLRMTPQDQISLLNYLVNSKIILACIKGIVPPKQNRKAYDDIFPGLTPSD